MEELTVVSIIICTCNRAEALKLTLESLEHVCIPEDMPCELLIVDNGPSADTALVAQACRLSNMPVRYVPEPRRGQCYARNTGLAAAQGGIVLFTDDDLRFPTHWIEGMCRPIFGGEADAVTGGVRFAPHLVRPWMTEEDRTKMADTIWVDAQNPQRMVGANMAFSKSVLEKVPAFDTELGPGALGFADETLFSMQLKKAGYRLKAALDVIVEHHFDPARLTYDSLLKMACNHERSNAYVKYHWKHERIWASWFRQFLRQMRLNILRRLKKRELQNAECPPGWESNHASVIAMFHQYRIESKRPRNYDRFGLVKHGGDPGRRDAPESVLSAVGPVEEVRSVARRTDDRMYGRGEAVIDPRPEGEQSRRLISVVIPTCRRNNLLALCLDRLAPGVQTLPPEQYEVVVTDDGTDDQNARAMLAEHYPWARWTPGPRRGPAANRNHGASLATSPWIAFTDDDCLPVPGWLQAYAAALRPDTFVYEGKTTCEGKQPTPLEYSPINLYGGQLWSCNMIIAKDTLDAIDGFDENYPHAHMEDTDLRERLKASGYVFPFVAEAVIDHPPRPRHWRSLAASQESEVVYWYKQGHTHPFAGRLVWQFTKYRLSIIKRSILRDGLTLATLRAISLLPAELGYVARHVHAWDRKYSRQYSAVPHTGRTVITP